MGQYTVQYIATAKICAMMTKEKNAAQDDSFDFDFPEDFGEPSNPQENID